MSNAHPVAFETGPKTEALPANHAICPAQEIETATEPSRQVPQEIGAMAVEALDISGAADWSRYGLDETAAVKQIVSSEPGTEMSRADLAELFPKWMHPKGRSYAARKLLAKMEKDVVIAPYWGNNGEKGSALRYRYGQAPADMDDGSVPSDEIAVSTPESVVVESDAAISDHTPARTVVDEPPEASVLEDEALISFATASADSEVDVDTDELPAPKPDTADSFPSIKDIKTSGVIAPLKKSGERFETSAEEFEDDDSGTSLPSDPTSRTIAANVRDFILGKGSLNAKIFPESEEDLPEDDAAYRATIYAGMKVALWHRDYSADGCSERLTDISHMLNSVPKRKAATKKAAKPKATAVA